MIIASAPLRVSFLGGGTDFYEFFSQHEGHVLATSIAKRNYVFVSEMDSTAAKRFRFTYRSVEEVDNPKEITHPVVREILSKYSLEDIGVNIATMSDIPGGTGLGNSSAFTLAFMGAIYKLKQIESSDLEILHNAIELDRQILGEVGGWQDHYISFTGGMKHFTFKKDKVVVERSPFTTLEEHLLNESLLFLRVGKERKSGAIQELFVENLRKKNNYSQLIALSDLTKNTINYLKKDLNWEKKFNKLSESINLSWELKQSMSDISTLEISKIIQEGIQNGASSGKLLGAGKSGFIMFLVHPENQSNFRKKFDQARNLKFDNIGLEIQKFKSGN